MQVSNLEETNNELTSQFIRSREREQKYAEEVRRVREEGMGEVERVREEGVEEVERVREEGMEEVRRIREEAEEVIKRMQEEMSRGDGGEEIEKMRQQLEQANVERERLEEELNYEKQRFGENKEKVSSCYSFFFHFLFCFFSSFCFMFSLLPLLNSCNSTFHIRLTSKSKNGKTRSHKSSKI